MSVVVDRPTYADQVDVVLALEFPASRIVDPRNEAKIYGCTRMCVHHGIAVNRRVTG